MKPIDVTEIYRTLCLDEYDEITEKTIERAYRKKMREYHPDLNHTLKSSTAIAQKLNIVKEEALKNISALNKMRQESIVRKGAMRVTSGEFHEKTSFNKQNPATSELITMLTDFLIKQGMEELKVINCIKSLEYSVINGDCIDELFNYCGSDFISKLFEYLKSEESEEVNPEEHFQLLRDLYVSLNERINNANQKKSNI